MVKSHRYCVAFSGVIREHLRELEQFIGQHTYERNQVVYFMDDPSDELYLIDLQDPDACTVLLTTELEKDPSPPWSGFIHDEDTSLLPDG